MTPPHLQVNLSFVGTSKGLHITYHGPKCERRFIVDDHVPSYDGAYLIPWNKLTTSTTVFCQVLGSPTYLRQYIPDEFFTERAAHWSHTPEYIGLTRPIHRTRYGDVQMNACDTQSVYESMLRALQRDAQVELEKYSYSSKRP